MKKLTVSASCMPTDAIRDFVDAVASLQSVASAHCCWFQEPGEMHWEFLRSKDRVMVEVIRFAGVLIPGRHGSDGVSVFKAEAQWVDFARQVLKSALKARNSLGVDGYHREWRHPFPKEACDKLETPFMSRRAVARKSVTAWFRQPTVLNFLLYEN